MPKLWSTTIEAHRREVRAAILDAAGALLAERGPLGLSMSEIAQEAGIGRATLYKYFRDVETIVLAWHDREIEAHLDALGAVLHDADDAGQRLRDFLDSYAQALHASHRHHGTALGALLHADVRVADAERTVRKLLEDLIAAAAAERLVRRDVRTSELVSYCLHALSAAPKLPTRSAVRRLVALTLAGLEFRESGR